MVEVATTIIRATRSIAGAHWLTAIMRWASRRRAGLSRRTVGAAAALRPLQISIRISPGLGALVPGRDSPDSASSAWALKAETDGRSWPDFVVLILVAPVLPLAMRDPHAAVPTTGRSSGKHFAVVAFQEYADLAFDFMATGCRIDASPDERRRLGVRRLGPLTGNTMPGTHACEQ